MTDLSQLPLDELAKQVGEDTPGAVSPGASQAEFNRRVMIKQMETLEAQRAAAQAQLEMACATEKMVRWTMWSVVAMAASLVVALLVHCA